MEKEAGAIELASSAYQQAASLRPNDAEPLLHLGHMAKAWCQPIEAASHFVTALQRDPGNLEATSELVRLLPDPDDVNPALWSAMLKVLDIDPAEPMLDGNQLLPPGAIAFDVTDLLAFFGQRRLPTGIQRVQIEISLACLEQTVEVPPVFCVYASARRGWIRLKSDLFEHLCRLARQSDDIQDPVWTLQLDRLYRRIAVSRTVRFARTVTLINLGTSWSDRNYLLDVRIARVCHGLIYIPFVHDLIPLIGPEWCMDTLSRDYRSWFSSLLHSADAYLVNSESTRADLLRVANEWGTTIAASSTAVILLNGDFRQPAANPALLSELGLKPRAYVLFVSTLEPRKNHIGAFHAWLKLADDVGETSAPHLVCVGGRGWLNEGLYRMLRERPALRRMVSILHGVPDDLLAALYQHCLFVLYPSFYEGWGLPVSEALSYGKVPAISRVSSLPEAGGVYARYFDPADVDDIAAVAGSLLDEHTRAKAETTIRQGYVPRSWHQILHDIITQARRIVPLTIAILPRLSGAGLWTLALPGLETSVHEVQGEALRHGQAWQAPGLEGCRIAGEDALLWFEWGGLASALLRIRFAATEDGAHVRVGYDNMVQDSRLKPGSTADVELPLPATPQALRISIFPLAGDVIVQSIIVTLV